ncbi:EAL domain-containing protein [Acidiferrimicrobium sp. IK]|uniref:putative bifunctional diguanylate cyclase/phosphodiesterase n=1 Tax=Acidiferrimicrobium sp. IK TaxID=2871700 RepID=UPI0021CB2FDB|nr:EAL domain-containing protein [Acidiferrimicrobium sp. IK]MCU4184048.1 EAL domain-containing protein [Acidiferrimicrobium sp. IK]
MAPGLPGFYVNAIDGAPIGPSAGSCGTAIFTRAATWAVNICSDHRWDPWREVALAAGLRACYSCPIFDAGGVVLGSFALYWAEAHQPGPEDRRRVEMGTALAAIAIERAQTEAAMAHAAKHDGLTGLPNRAFFLSQLREALSGPGGGHGVAVLFMDLDRFKVVNDSFGHAEGDRLLVAVADRLRAITRDGETVARFGGDEFTLLCHVGADPGHAQVVAARVAEALSRPFPVGPRQFHVSVSIGVAFGDEGRAPEDIVRNADLAMYRSKQRGRSRIETFDSSLLLGSRQRYDDEAALRRSIDADDVTLHYQLIANLVTGRPTGMEALLRWRRSSGEMVAPPVIVAIAEEVGLIDQLGLQILATALDQLVALRAAGLVGPAFSVSVNVAAAQLADKSLPEAVLDALRVRGLHPAHLRLELTESHQLGEDPETGTALARLNEMGIPVVIDDFGTGYSSISRLRELPVKGLKVDRSFVAAVGTDHGRARQLLTGILAIGRALELPVVAEGVETPEQLQLLRDLDCGEAQGFFLARPQGGADLNLLLATHPSW